MSQYRTCDTPPDNKSMTNDQSRAVVITGKQSGPVQGRNATFMKHHREEQVDAVSSGSGIV